ncbi:hypothetical protein Cgig2_025902 [Carnegiea gigantea]|uniref:RRM domain-containing protein n=1 Tax=Carnegiea gigantea TaxID=171969 RepID=A0A9Q1QDU4_9CARY|nr:hypothetical protein Cgig2_025902 [Carnegiea gigantea]
MESHQNSTILCASPLCVAIVCRPAKVVIGALFDRASAILSILKELNGFLPLPSFSSTTQTTKPKISTMPKDHEKIYLRKQWYDHLHSVFIENLPSDMTAGQLRDEFAPFGNIIDPYISNKVARSGKKFGFVRFKSRDEGEKDIQSTHGKDLGRNWNVVNAAFVSYDDVDFDGGNVAQDSFDVTADSCDNFVHNRATNIPIIGQNDHQDEDHGENFACSDDSRIISQPMGTRNSHPSSIGKLPTKKKSYRDSILSKSSANDIDELVSFISRAPTVLRKTSIDLSPPPNERDESAAIRRIMQSLRKKLENR